MATSEHHGSGAQLATGMTVFSIVVMTAPVLYVSLLCIPPSSLLSDTKFWFLLSNAIILVVAADSGAFGAAAATDSSAVIYGYRASRNEPRRRRSGSSGSSRRRLRSREDKRIPNAEEGGGAGHPASSTCLALIPTEGAAEVSDRGEHPTGETERPRRTTSALAAPPPDHGRENKNGADVLRRSVSTEGRKRLAAPGDHRRESEYAAMSDEELNRRVEEFIRRFNMEMRRQQQMIGNDHESV